MTTHKKGKITVIVIGCILIVSYILYVYIMEQKTSIIKDADQFGENATWKYGVLLDKDRVFSSNGGPICYTDMSKKMTVPLCTRADCEHNTDDCTACYESNVDFIYPYQGKLYLGCRTNKDLLLYRTNLDGSDREKIADYSLEDVISEVQYMVAQSKIYIALQIEDTSLMILDEDGNCSDVPNYGELLCFDLNTAKYEKVAALGKGYYGYNLFLRYVEGTRLYYEFEGRELPYDEMYHSETGDLLKPELADQEVEEVASIDLNTGKIQAEDRYVTRDYVGSEEDISYFLEYQSGHILSGDIRLERNGVEDQKIHIKDLEQKEGDLCLLKDHFVFNEEGTGDKEGRVSFFDRSGNQEFVIEETDNYVIGERDSYYILCSFVYPKNESGMGSYIEKKDIKQLKTKAVELWED